MTEIPISPDIWKLAGAILTPLQLTALTLRERHGYSWNMIAITMNSTRTTAKEHHRAATRKMLDAIEAAGGDVDAALDRATHPLIVVEMETNRAAFAEPRPSSEKKEIA